MLVNEEDAGRLPIDAYVVRLNRTPMFMIAEEDAPFIDRIDSIYLFDANERVHCCEITPSYWMIHVCDEVIYKDDTPEEKWDELDEKYGHCYGDWDCYIHCHSIDAIVAAAKPFTVHHYGESGVSYEDTSRDEQMEAIRESFNCNHTL